MSIKALLYTWGTFSFSDILYGTVLNHCLAHHGANIAHAQGLKQQLLQHLQLTYSMMLHCFLYFSLNARRGIYDKGYS